MKKFMKESISDRIFNTVNYLFIAIITISFIIPFYHIFIISISPPDDSALIGIRFWPSRVFTEGYNCILQNIDIWTGFLNSIIRVIGTVVLGLIFMTTAAYSLSKKYLRGRNIITMFIVFTMFFQGGIVPSYINIRNLHLLNNRLALILPVMVDAFWLLIIRNYLMTLPDSLEESAMIDGAGYLTILTRIIIPIAKPILATVALWAAVWNWNQWFDCMLYISDVKKQVVQLVLRRILEAGSDTFSIGVMAKIKPTSATLQAAAVFVTTLPILMVYPFVQKYFVTGITLGSVKG
jgi:putative aldouronate transport system permease protein